LAPRDQIRWLQAAPGAAIVRGVDGYSDFNALHSNRHDDEVELIAFDVLAMDGDDLRKLPLSMRKANLQRQLSRRAACNMGLEGLVSKRADRPYRGGRSKDWIKVKNRQHHAFSRVLDAMSR
jgi:bifunctional non-homologous end joining protein LigD